VFLAVHTSVAEHLSPTARHVFALATVVSQQPVLQLSPAQQGCPTPPQPAHLPASQRSPAVQVAPTARQVNAPGSQQPVSHTLPAQQGLPGVPQL
jgi:hypothetical protein